MKPTKKRILWSLLPFYLLLSMLPFVIFYEFNWLDRAMDETILGVALTFIYGIFVIAPFVFSYWLYLIGAAPFYSFFEKHGLIIKDTGPSGLLSFDIPEISVQGLLVLAVFYSTVLYLLSPVLGIIWKFIKPNRHPVK